METWHRDIHPPSPTLLFDTLSLNLLTPFFKYAPFRNTNDGRRFTNEHSLDAFHPLAQNRVDVEALVNEILTNLKSALNLLRVEEKETVVWFLSMAPSQQPSRAGTVGRKVEEEFK